MDQAVLMHADIDERAEGRHVGDGAFQQHARLQVFDFVDAVGEGCGLETGARIAAGLFQFRNNIAHGRQTEFLIDENFRIQCLQGSAVAHEGAYIAPAGGDDLLGDIIGFGMDRGGIERFCPVGDAQKARALFERALAEAADLQ